MNSTISDTITKEGLLIAFCSGALVAGGAVAAVSVWKNENKTMQQIVVSAAAGGAISNRRSAHSRLGLPASRHQVPKLLGVRAWTAAAV